MIPTRLRALLRRWLCPAPSRSTPPSTLETLLLTREGGIVKRLDEQRELAELLLAEAPTLFETHPWCEEWLRATEAYLSALVSHLSQAGLLRLPPPTARAHMQIRPSVLGVVDEFAQPERSLPLPIPEEAMTLQQLLTLAQGLAPDLIVVLARDREGNSYSPLDEVEVAAYTAQGSWWGEVSQEGAQPCLVLWPSN